MNATDIQPFCSTDPVRHYLLKPFSIGEFTYATNGRVAIRVPRLPDVQEVDGAPQNIVRLFNDRESQAGVEYVIPEIGPFEWEPCKTCRTLGGLKKCPGCNGDGIVECDLGHEHDCDECKGRGDMPADRAVAEACHECEGTGKVEATTYVEIGGARFADRLLGKLKALQGCKSHIHTAVDAARFTFDGGDGLIMPVRNS